MGGGWVGNSGSGSLALHVFSAECRLLALGCGFFVPNGCVLAYPRCGRNFRPLALCLATIEQFYWPLDSSSTVIGPVK